MRKVFVTYNNIISSLGFDTFSNVQNVSKEISGIKKHSNKKIFQTPFYASLVETEKINSAFEKLGNVNEFTRLEKMMILSLNDVIQQSNIQLTDRTALLISTTKGNVDVLSQDSKFPKKRAYLSELGKQIQLFFDFKNDPIIVSNACVSGILSVAIAKRFIQNETYDNVLIVSGDIISEFVLSGFNSFQAISDNPCKPFSKNRTGVTLGEAAASVLVTSDKKYNSKDTVEILGDASCNDANHISGPSRTGEGLFRSMKSALKEATMIPDKVDYISAHGTATSFNDEMEAIAMNRMKLENVPMNSLKGYYGHTLGASGLVETIIGMQSIHSNTLYTSLGFDELGVSRIVNVIKKSKNKNLNTFLKTASGFGGCNTAVIFKKI